MISLGINFQVYITIVSFKQWATWTEKKEGAVNMIII